MSKFLSTKTGRDFRPDLLRALALALVTTLLWCACYDRWTTASWQTPVTYLADPQQGDILDTLARMRAAEDGHMVPLLLTNVPELGAPHIANWNDFPMTEKPFFCLTGLLAWAVGLFAAANASLLMGQVLASLAFYTACRLLDCSWIWSFAGGLIFAFSRYAFAQGLHHVTLVYCWQVPLGLVVCEWIFRGDGIRFGERRFVFALVMAIVTGVQHVYYTNLFVQFLLFGGLLQGWRHGWRAALPAAAVAATTVGAFLLMNANTFAYGLIHGDNSVAVVRDYKWLEFYGLKLVDLVMPPPDHRFGPFAAWGTNHLQEIILSPGELPPTAYLGLAGLGALAWLVAVSLRRMAAQERVPLEAWLILWIILYAEVGGINGIIGTLGFQLFRTTTRYSIFILCLALMFAVRRLSLLEYRNKWLVYGAAFVVVCIALGDQAPPLVTASDLEETARAVASDREFTAKMEERLPAQAMVFQIPVMDYPESPIPGVGPYDHLRPYLYAHQLRFSFGSDKGRPQEQWQHDLDKLPLGVMVSRLESYGFSALYVNLNCFKDKGAALIEALKNMGRSEMFQSDQGDLLCVLLKPSAQPVKPDDY